MSGTARFTMRIRCSCGRNLADVVPSPRTRNQDLVQSVEGVHGEPREHWGTFLAVTRRSGVEQASRETSADYRRIYTWRCRCGQHWERRADRLAIAWRILWRRPTAPRNGGLVVAVLDAEL